jgi:hypothetical protein
MSPPLWQAASCWPLATALVLLVAQASSTILSQYLLCLCCRLTCRNGLGSRRSPGMPLACFAPQESFKNHQTIQAAGLPCTFHARSLALRGVWDCPVNFSHHTFCTSASPTAALPNPCCLASDSPIQHPRVSARSHSIHTDRNLGWLQCRKVEDHLRRSGDSKHVPSATLQPVPCTCSLLHLDTAVLHGRTRPSDTGGIEHVTKDGCHPVWLTL